MSISNPKDMTRPKHKLFFLRTLTKLTHHHTRAPYLSRRFIAHPEPSTDWRRYITISPSVENVENVKLEKRTNIPGRNVTAKSSSIDCVKTSFFSPFLSSFFAPPISFQTALRIQSTHRCFFSQSYSRIISYDLLQCEEMLLKW